MLLATVSLKRMFRSLCDNPDLSQQGFVLNISEVVTADRNAPLCRIMKPGQQVDQGRLSGTRFADDCDFLTPFPRETGSPRGRARCRKRKKTLSKRISSQSPESGTASGFS